MDPLTGVMIGSSLLSAGTGILGANAQAKATREANEANAQLQRDFAQQGIRWKVADAKAAGIHPLYALGANTVSASPSYVADSSAGAGYQALGNMGQDITRAMAQTRTQEERQLSALSLANAQADLDGKVIDNQIRASQLKKLAMTAPPMPSGSDQTNFVPGQGNSPLVKVKPSERTVSQPGRLAQEAGWTPDVAYARTDTGFTPVPSKDVKERIEDQFIPELMWSVRNQIMPNFGAGGSPPNNQLPKGATGWKWNYFKQEYQPKYPSKAPSRHDSYDMRYQSKVY